MHKRVGLPNVCVFGGECLADCGSWHMRVSVQLCSSNVPVVRLEYCCVILAVLCVTLLAYDLVVSKETSTSVFAVRI